MWEGPIDQVGKCKNVSFIPTVDLLLKIYLSNMNLNMIESNVHINKLARFIIVGFLLINAACKESNKSP